MVTHSTGAQRSEDIIGTKGLSRAFAKQGQDFDTRVTIFLCLLPPWGLAGVGTPRPRALRGSQGHWPEGTRAVWLKPICGTSTNWKEPPPAHSLR